MRERSRIEGESTVSNLNEISEFMDRLGEASNNKRNIMDSKSLASPTSPPNVGDLVQWGVLGNDTYIPSGLTCRTLPPACYKVSQDDRGRIIVIKTDIVTDKLLRLPDTASDRVLDSIKIFWEAKDSFKAKGQLFKRGILLWGPPGSGKTVTIMLLIHDLIERAGIVILVNNPELVTQALEYTRKIEPERPLICVMEDLDEMIDRYGESSILSLLDGENQVDNVVHVASTNYPEDLDARLVNRPSRFDEVIKIDMPSDEARRLYIKSKVTPEELNQYQIEKWVTDTTGMSIAHLRELVIAVFCLGRDYQETLDRLKRMARSPKSSNLKQTGFTSLNSNP
jgi:hypothetical protein